MANTTHSAIVIAVIAAPAASMAQNRSAAAAAATCGAGGPAAPAVQRRRREIRTRPATSKRRSCRTARFRRLTRYGNFIIGPTHNPAPEMTAQPGVPQGTFRTSRWSRRTSKIYPGIAREQGTFGTPDPNNPAKLDVTTSRPRRLHAACRGVCAAAVRARNGGAVHRRR